jgi:DNA polymerase III epsilon subunit-like protein
MALEFYILDVESTGLSVDIHEINQISIMRVADKEQKTFRVKVKRPGCYNQQALEIQGITPKDLRKGEPIEYVIKQIEDFMNVDGKTPAHRVIVAHNAVFDRKFVHRAWKNEGKEFPADLWICTIAFAKRYTKKHNALNKVGEVQKQNGIEVGKDKNGTLKPKYGLNNFLTGIGLEIKTGAHNAEVDVINTCELFNWLMKSNTEYVSLILRVPQVEKPVELDVDDF